MDFLIYHKTVLEKSDRVRVRNSVGLFAMSFDDCTMVGPCV